MPRSNNMSPPIRVLIAVPVHNEARYVRAVLSRITEQVGAAPDRFDIRVLVIDDGSTDTTPAILDELARDGTIDVIRHQTNLGYGRALREAFHAADQRGFDWVLTMDCDEQHEPASIPAFLDEIARDRHDIVSGSRYLNPDEGDDAPPPERRAVNRTITTELNDRLDLTLTDGFCGFKAHRVGAMRRLALTEDGYAFPMQFWVQAVAAGLSIAEIPVRLIYNDLNRTFGHGLDDRDRRLAHYRAVMHATIARHAECLPASATEGIDTGAILSTAPPAPSLCSSQSTNTPPHRAGPSEGDTLG